MIIGFTGTRYGMTDAQWEGVRRLMDGTNPHEHEFHHGDCEGADEEAHKIAMNLGFRIVIHPPIIHSLRAYCQGDVVLPAKPYDERNLAIVQVSDVIIAAPPTEAEMPHGGTWQTVRFSRENKKPCKVVLPSGIIVDA